MSHTTETALTVNQLRELANDPAATLRQLTDVMRSLVAGEEQLEWASEALENCGVPPAESVPALVELAGHGEIIVATWACKLLARLGESAAPAQNALVKLLHHSTETIVREEAARALGVTGSLSAAARAALEDAAASGGPRLKRLAAAALGS